MGGERTITVTVTFAEEKVAEPGYVKRANENPTRLSPKYYAELHLN